MSPSYLWYGDPIPAKTVFILRRAPGLENFILFAEPFTTVLSLKASVKQLLKHLTMDDTELNNKIVNHITAELTDADKIE